MSTPEARSSLRPRVPRSLWPGPPPPLIWGSALLHAAGAAALVAVPERWPWILGTIFADHLALAAGGMTPRASLLGPNLTRLPRAAGVALTFDDGPDPAVTPRVLDLLAERGARASFFAIGRLAAAHPELTAEIARRGHRVENHSFSHSNLFSCYPPGPLGRDVSRAQEAIATATGRLPRLFRAPAGLRGPLLERELTPRGLALTSWTRRGFDTVDRDPARIARRLTRGLAAGDILVLHDGRAARTAGGQPVVLEVLPRLLDALAERGLPAVTIELAGEDG